MTALAQKDKPYYPFQSELSECQEEIPLYYATNKKGPLLEAAKRLEGVEIVVLVKSKMAWRFQYFYLEIYDASDGKSALLRPTRKEESYGNWKVLFLDYKPKKHFFFRAECFDSKQKENPEFNKVFLYTLRM